VKRRRELLGPGKKRKRTDKGRLPAASTIGEKVHYFVLVQKGGNEPFREKIELIPGERTFNVRERGRFLCFQRLRKNGAEPIHRLGKGKGGEDRRRGTSFLIPRSVPSGTI